MPGSGTSVPPVDDEVVLPPEVDEVVEPPVEVEVVLPPEVEVELDELLPHIAAPAEWPQLQ